MENKIIPVVFVCIIVIGIITSFYFSKKAIVKRKLKKATGKRISEFLTGDIAKVVGKVECVGKPIIAPLSGRPCAYYYILVEQRVSSGKSSHWSTLIEEEQSGAFVIKDGKYAAHINTKNVKSYIVEDRKYSSGFLEDATEVLESYLNKHDIQSENFIGMNKTIRYKEGILEEGELMAVIGMGEWQNASHEQLPASYGKILVLNATSKQPIYLSDDPDTVKVTYA